MKKIIAGFVSGVILGGAVATSAPVLANAVKMLQAHYTVNEIYVDGNPTGMGKYLFIADDSIYVKLRTMVEVQGGNITWDDKTRSAYIETKAAPITQEEAEKIALEVALKEIEGAVVESSKQCYIDKILHYHVFINDSEGNPAYEYYVDAVTKEVKIINENKVEN